MKDLDPFSIITGFARNAVFALMIISIVAAIARLLNAQYFYVLKECGEGFMCWVWLWAWDYCDRRGK